MRAPFGHGVNPPPSEAHNNINPARPGASAPVAEGTAQASASADKESEADSYGDSFESRMEFLGAVGTFWCGFIAIVNGIIFLGSANGLTASQMAALVIVDAFAFAVIWILVDDFGKRPKRVRYLQDRLMGGGRRSLFLLAISASVSWGVLISSGRPTTPTEAATGTSAHVSRAQIEFSSAMPLQLNATVWVGRSKRNKNKPAPRAEVIVRLESGQEAKEVIPTTLNAEGQLYGKLDFRAPDNDSIAHREGRPIARIELRSPEETKPEVLPAEFGPLPAARRAVKSVHQKRAPARVPSQVTPKAAKHSPPQNKPKVTKQVPTSTGEWTTRFDRGKHWRSGRNVMFVDAENLSAGYAVTATGSNEIDLETGFHAQFTVTLGGQTQRPEQCFGFAVEGVFAVVFRDGAPGIVHIKQPNARRDVPAYQGASTDTAKHLKHDALPLGLAASVSVRLSPLAREYGRFNLRVEVDGKSIWDQSLTIAPEFLSSKKRPQFQSYGSSVSVTEFVLAD